MGGRGLEPLTPSVSKRYHLLGMVLDITVSYYIVVSCVNISIDIKRLK